MTSLLSVVMQESETINGEDHALPSQQGMVGIFFIYFTYNVGNIYKLYCFAQQADAAAAEELRKKRRFKKFTFRGVDLDQLLDMSNEQLIEMYTARLRRRFNRGLKRKHLGLLKRLRKAKKECPALEKPEVGLLSKHFPLHHLLPTDTLWVHPHLCFVTMCFGLFYEFWG